MEIGNMFPLKSTQKGSIVMLSQDNKYIAQGETRPEKKLGGCNGRTNNTSFGYKCMCVT